MKIEIDGNYIDPETVDSILQVEVDTTASRSGGAFDFKPETEIILKNGRSFRTSKSTQEVHNLLYGGLSMKGSLAKGSSTSSPCQELGIDPAKPGTEYTTITEVGGRDYVEKLGEDIIKVLKQQAEHLHTLSEMLTRLTLHITDGNDIRFRQV